jgi:hypothetical protein
MMSSRVLRAAAATTLLATSTACHPGDSADDQSAVESPIVEGNLEPTRYPAAGYLVFQIKVGPHAGEIFRPNCGAMLIAPNAIMTATHCVDSDGGADVVAVGFGDGFTGETYDVVGTSKDWIHPKSFIEAPWGPGGAMVQTLDQRHDLAVIQLVRPVAGIEPMPLTRSPIASGASALVIGYGRVQEGKHLEIDDFPNRPDHRDRYPGIRKSADLEVVVARDMIDAYPKPSTDARASGGICFGDSGSSIIMADGSVAGVLSSWPDEDNLAEMIDGTPRCRKDNGGSWARVQFPTNASFIEERLRTAAAALAATTATTTNGGAR